ncbi:MAG TPA: cation:proton antiporter [Terriglobia bacterium]|jgi:Kef-type K+ transport system membrane component KefB|nr:cation:proton antiporter [Terriglobia bacterium]
MNISLQVLLFISLLVLLSKALGGLSGRMGLPVVLGELLAGVVLGPTLINVWRFSWFSGNTTVLGTSPISLAAVMNVLAGLGVVVLMFLAGLETDLHMMKNTVGPAFWCATGGVLLPLLGGAALSRLSGFKWNEAVFVGTILTATSVSITAQTLMNLNKLRSKVGSTILGAAVIDDVLGLLVLSFVIALEMRTAQSPAGWRGITETVGRIAVFSGLTFWLGPMLIRLLFRQARRLHGPHVAVAIALVICFLFAFLAESLGGMASITGAYLAGLFVAATPAHQEVIDDLRAMTNSFFGPLFFVSIGLEINARQLGGHIGFFLVILAVAILGKTVGCGLGTWANGFTAGDSLTVGVGMIPRGEVGLITASIGYTAGLVSTEVYSIVVVLVLATTLVTPLLLRYCPGMREPDAEMGSSPPVLSDVSVGS